MADDVVQAARQFLATFPEVMSELGSDAGTVYLFQWSLHVPVEGTQEVACVLSTTGSWTSPNTHNTAKFPRLLVEVYADPIRDVKRSPTVYNTQQRALRVAEKISDVLHRPFAGEWGPVANPAYDSADPEAEPETIPLRVFDDNLRIIASHRLDEPAPFPVPDGDGMVVARVAFGLSVG